MHRRTSSVTRLALAALLIGFAAIGCAGNSGTGTGSGRQTTMTPAAQTDQTPATGTPATVTGNTAPDHSGALGTPGTSGAPAAAAPQIDDQLNAIDQSLGNLNGSLSGADAGQSAGE